MKLFRPVFCSFMVIVSFAASAADRNGDGVETILLPIGLTGQKLAGAYGTLWTGNVSVANSTGEPVGLIRAIDCGPGCGVYGPEQLGGINALTSRPDLGVLLSPYAHHAPSLTFSNRIWELTRAGQPRGVEIPVVREGNFFTGPKTLLSIPSGADVRIALRAYDPSRERASESQSLSVQVLTAAGTVIGEFVLTPVVPHVPEGVAELQPGFAAVNDLSTVVPDVRLHPIIHIRIRPHGEREYWAMASVTDNETQTVSVVTAQ